MEPKLSQVCYFIYKFGYTKCGSLDNTVYLKCPMALNTVYFIFYCLLPRWFNIFIVHCHAPLNRFAWNWRGINKLLLLLLFLLLGLTKEPA